MDDLDKLIHDTGDTAIQKTIDVKTSLKQDLKELKDENVRTLRKEVEELKNFVMAETQAVNTNNDGIYEKYDAKLKKIKDVCAQYFSKYEKHLINHQTIVKDLERT